MATHSANIKKDPAASGGKIGKAEFAMVNIPCLPLDPVDPELRQSLGIDSPHRLLQTFIEGKYDIRNGYLLVEGGKEYPIRSVAPWDWRGTQVLALVIEDISQ